MTLSRIGDVRLVFLPLLLRYGANVEAEDAIGPNG
jgi:hypothetical protein